MAQVMETSEMETEFAVSTAMPRDYFELMKPGVMRLVVFTAIAGLVIAPGTINPLYRDYCHLVHRHRCWCIRCPQHVV